MLDKPVYELKKSVPAIQIHPGEGETRLGVIAKLPEGSVVEVWGPGFNSETRKVQCNGLSYYMFSADLETWAILSFSNAKPKKGKYAPKPECRYDGIEARSKP